MVQGSSQCLVIGRLLVRFPLSACQSVLGQETEPQTAPDVLAWQPLPSVYEFMKELL